MPRLPERGVGLDVGSTLAKVAHADGGELRLAYFASTDREGLLAYIDAAREAPLALTGAGAAAWTEALADRQPRRLSEFEATAAGARVLLAREHGTEQDPLLVVSVGTGTSVLRVEGETVERVGGTALGGGTLLGLGRLLCGTGEYAELARQAAAGDRRRVDLLVGDVYPEGVDALYRELTAANFGRVDSEDPADLAHAVCGLLGENLGLLCGALARVHGATVVLYCGATLMDNAPLAGVLQATTAFAGAPAQVLSDGTYCGAVGALASLACPAPPTA